MTLYRKFGQGLAILCCVAMLGLAVGLTVSGGITQVNERNGTVTYFYERNDVRAAAFVCCAFLLSIIANACTPDLPEAAAGISLLPLLMTFYQMAFENMNYVVAAIVLLLAAIHTASNLIAWYDKRQAKKKKARVSEGTDAPQDEQTNA